VYIYKNRGVRGSAGIQPFIVITGKNMAAIQQITLEDVAAACGLSKATVTQILSGKSKYKFREETKRKVIETAEKLNYHPNLFASSLRKQENNIILCIVGDAFRYAEIMQFKKLEQEFGSRGYNLLLQFLVDLSDEQKIEFIRNFLYFPAGILIHSLGFKNPDSYFKLLPLFKSAPPILSLNDEIKDGCTDYIKINWGINSIPLILKCFRDKKCKNIACCIDGNDDLDDHYSRQFTESAVQAGFNAKTYISPVSCEKYDYYTAGKYIAGLIAADADWPDGIRIGSDEMLFAINEELRYKHHIDLLERYYVISGGDSEFSRKYANPPDIIIHDHQVAARMAAEYIIDLLESGKKSTVPHCIGSIDTTMIPGKK